MNIYKANLRVLATIVALIFSTYRDTFADCEDSGLLLNDQFINREWRISNETESYISKSLFNIPSLLQKATCFYVLQTEEIETPLATTNGVYFKTKFTNDFQQHYVLYWVLIDSVHIPLWYRTLSFGDHSEKWLDFNGDKNPELILFVGFEASTKSYLYLNNVKTLSFSENNFSLIFSQEDEYVFYGELESQIVIFEHDGETRTDEAYYGDFEAIEILKSEYDLYSDKLLLSEIIEHYSKSLASYDSANINVDYGINPSPVPNRLLLLQPVRIYTLRSRNLVDITCELKTHIQWRISILNKLLPHTTEKGGDVIRKLISYYKRCL